MEVQAVHFVNAMNVHNNFEATTRLIESNGKNVYYFSRKHRYTQLTLRAYITLHLYLFPSTYFT